MARRALGLRARGARRLAFEINDRPTTEPGLQARSQRLSSQHPKKEARATLPSSDERKPMFDEITVIAHSCIRISGDATVYFDPFEMTEEPHDADIVCVTHDHYDHFSPDDLRRTLRDNTTVVVPESMRENRDLQQMASKLHMRDIHYLKPDNTLDLGATKLETVRAYNVDKNFHLREYDWLGYILTMNGTRYYVTGDTDAHPENLSVSCDVVLLPVGGTYTFDAPKAARFASRIQAGAAIPTHYGSVVGTKDDGARFVAELARIAPHITSCEKLHFA